MTLVILPLKASIWTPLSIRPTSFRRESRSIKSPQQFVKEFADGPRASHIGFTFTMRVSFFRALKLLAITQSLQKAEADPDPKVSPECEGVVADGNAKDKQAVGDGVVEETIDSNSNGSEYSDLQNVVGTLIDPVSSGRRPSTDVKKGDSRMETESGRAFIPSNHTPCDRKIQQLQPRWTRLWRLLLIRHQLVERPLPTSRRMSPVQKLNQVSRLFYLMINSIGNRTATAPVDHNYFKALADPASAPPDIDEESGKSFVCSI
jgi:hypothetical protein